MGNIVDFDSSKLSELIDLLGIRKTWLSILATHISSRPELNYILQNDVFRKTDILDKDLLAGLSIGEIGVLYEYSVSRVDPKSRKDNGQYFTPDDVAIFMADYQSTFPDGIWLDPCCGVGNLSWHLVARQDSPEYFLLNNIFLSDRDELALLIARTLLTAAFQNEITNLFEAIESKFIVFDFLSVADYGDDGVFKTSDELSRIPSHDFVIVNPPYLAVKQDHRFESANAGDLYAYFLENIIKTSRGFISVTPQSFTNAGKFKILRRLLLSKFSDLTIFAFDNVPANIFRGIKFGSKNSNKANSIRAAIMIARPGEGQHRISSLLRWKNDERQALFLLAPYSLSVCTFTEEYFPKIGIGYEKLYELTHQAPKLREICVSQPTDYPLYVPSSPRYYISALKAPVNRASFHTIHFPNAESRDKAYLILNSSLAYWWWRVRDGGMTLSLETLMSTPLSPVVLDENLIQKLGRSEQTNRVYKQNAGQVQENVKHDLKLLTELTEFVMKDFAELLGRTHENSSLNRIRQNSMSDLN